MHLIHSRSWLCLSSVLLLLGCRDALSLAEPDLKVPQTANASISDAAHGGRPHFYFLPPLVPQPVYDSTFDAVRSPTVRICQVTNSTCGPLLAEYTTTSGPDSVMVQVDPIAEHYSVDWHTDRFALVDGSTYRIQVLIEGRQVGYVDLLRSGTDLKNAASGEVIQLVDGRTLPIRFRLEEGLERFRLVPAHAPDTVPDWIYDPANIESDSPLLAGSFLRNIVVVLFIPEATQAQRQSAVDLIGGEVVGGNWVTDDDGDYYVQIPEDGTAGPLLHAIELLEALPYVADAAPEFVEDPTGVTAYLRPKDGPGWQSWHINPADAAGEKWALEAISMPFAWGCETGSASSRVAVVDLGYHNASDFMTNVTNPGDAKLGYHQPDSLGHVQDHGTTVASILAARGNNGQGIAGVMWRADLRLYEASYRPFLKPAMTNRGAWRALRKAIVDKARVINISIHFDHGPWIKKHGQAPTPQDSAVVRAVAEYRDFLAIRISIREGLSPASRPLYVVAAGNFGVDASLSHWPALRTNPNFGSRVLVVGAAESGGVQPLPPTLPRWVAGGIYSSNWGDYVHVYAPGAAVTGLGVSGGSIQPKPVSGTSVAAPQAAGLAGLLFSFDPSLSAQEVKDLILHGAERGDRLVTDPSGSPKYLINAYESLKAAAERAGAPLCGNHVWAAGGQLRVRRTATLTETLAPLGAAEGWQVEALHGGKYVFYSTRGGDRGVAWNASTRSWALASPPADWRDRRSGADASVMGYSHDGDTLSYVDASVVSGTRWYETKAKEEAPVMLQSLSGGGASEVGRIDVNNLPGAVKVTCLERHPSNGFCYMSVTSGRTWLFRLGYPQNGRRAHVTVSPLKHVETDSTAWAPCSFDPSHECREVKSLQEHVETLAYTVDLETGAVASAGSIADESVFWIGQSETGESVVLGRGRWQITFWADAARYRQTGDPFYNFDQSLDRCVIEYRHGADFTPNGAPIQATPEACHWYYSDYPTYPGGGTIAPSVIPSSSLRLQSESVASGGTISIPSPILTVTAAGLRREAASRAAPRAWREGR